MVRKGLKAGGSELCSITTRRAENKLKTGYLQVRVSHNGKRVNGLAHRLVWQFFQGDIPDGMVLNHKNGVKSDNRLSNLEVCTYSENQKHAHRTGLIDQRGQKNPHAKLTDKEVVEIRLIYSQGSCTQEELGKRYKVAFQTISDIVRGRTRASQAGITGNYSHRRSRSIKQDPKTGRFLKKDKIDGQTYQEFPK